MDLLPMLATLADAPLQSKLLVYEPKYDGIRALVEIVPGRGRQLPTVRLWSRNGNEKTTQFPTIVQALTSAARNLKGPLVLDGEIVALDERGGPAGFQRLQGRMHLLDAKEVERAEHDQPAAFIAFDVLRDGKDDLTRRPLTERRTRLETVFAKTFRLPSTSLRPGKPETTEIRGADASPSKSRSFRLQAERSADVVRLSEQVAGDGREMYARAQKDGWEGLIAKEAASTYQPGRRTPAWRKIKLLKEEEFVVAGWTEPRQTRQHFGALLLGVYDRGVLVHTGQVGTGFDEKELARVSKLLKARATKASPFAEPIKTNEPAHWVNPDLVAQIRFTEWTADQKLRHPVYLGLRDDKAARDVTAPAGFRLKAEATKKSTAGFRLKAEATKKSAAGFRLKAEAIKKSTAGFRLKAEATKKSTVGFRLKAEATKKGSVEFRRKAAATLEIPVVSAFRRNDLDPVIDQLRALEDARKDGVITLPDGERVKVTNLAKTFWAAAPGKITKGDLLRYYVEVSPLILPCVADRPLVMKRFPNGVTGLAFYQHKVAERGAAQFVGGSLKTLLEMTQLAAISQDPWFSRASSPADADYTAIDLDPTETATFATVLDVARWVRDELHGLKVPAFLKTSGSRGLHIYIPLPPETSYESGMLFCQIVGTVVATRHPRAATVERTVARRAKGTVYIDYLQNIEGKTLATAYSARATAFAGVSTPLTWKELDMKLDPRDFTMHTAPARFRQVGDLWAGLRTAPPADLEAVLRKY